MLRAIKTFIKDPAPTAQYDQVVAGLNVVEGIVRAADPIRSPVRGQGCVAFFYSSFLMITEGRAPAVHKIKQVEAYAPFELEMEGGTIAVTPTKTTDFQQRDHQILQKQYGPKFQGVEEVVAPGARVRVRGKVRYVNDKPELKMTAIELLEKQGSAVVTAGKRKKPKKK